MPAFTRGATQHATMHAGAPRWQMAATLVDAFDTASRLQHAHGRGLTSDRAARRPTREQAVSEESMGNKTCHLGRAIGQQPLVRLGVCVSLDGLPRTGCRHSGCLWFNLPANQAACTWVVRRAVNQLGAMVGGRTEPTLCAELPMAPTCHPPPLGTPPFVRLGSPMLQRASIEQGPPVVCAGRRRTSSSVTGDS